MDGVNVYDQPVVIEDDVWCGANVTILKGVTIGHGSVVAAGAVVTKSFPPYSIIGGIPAKLLKMRFTEEEIKEHERCWLTICDSMTKERLYSLDMMKCMAAIFITNSHFQPLF